MHFHCYRLMPPEKAEEIRTQLLGLNWKQGQARTEELTGTIKKNLEIENSAMSNSLAKYVGEKIISHEQIQAKFMPKKLSGMKFNKYEHGGTYNRHTDSPMMGEVRSDLACTVFLTNPDEYEGGELCMEVDGERLELKGAQGECVVYPCGYPHWVNPVTSGDRVSGVTWIQSSIRDAKNREVLSNLQKLCYAVQAEANMEDDDDKCRGWMVDIAQIHGDLARQWTE